MNEEARPSTVTLEQKVDEGLQDEHEAGLTHLREHDFQVDGPIHGFVASKREARDISGLRTLYSKVRNRLTTARQHGVGHLDFKIVAKQFAQEVKLRQDEPDLSEAWHKAIYDLQTHLRDHLPEAPGKRRRKVTDEVDDIINEANHILHQIDDMLQNHIWEEGKEPHEAAAHAAQEILDKRAIQLDVKHVRRLSGFMLQIRDSFLAESKAAWFLDESAVLGRRHVFADHKFGTSADAEKKQKFAHFQLDPHFESGYYGIEVQNQHGNSLAGSPTKKLVHGRFGLTGYASNGFRKTFESQVPLRLPGLVPAPNPLPEMSPMEVKAGLNARRGAGNFSGTFANQSWKQRRVPNFHRDRTTLPPLQGLGLTRSTLHGGRKLIG